LSALHDYIISHRREKVNIQIDDFSDEISLKWTKKGKYDPAVEVFVEENWGSFHFCEK